MCGALQHCSIAALHVLCIGVENMCMQLQSEIWPPHWAATDQHLMQASALTPLTHNLTVVKHSTTLAELQEELSTRLLGLALQAVKASCIKIFAHHAVSMHAQLTNLCDSAVAADHAT